MSRNLLIFLMLSSIYNPSISQVNSKILTNAFHLDSSYYYNRNDTAQIWQLESKIIHDYGQFGEIHQTYTRYINNIWQDVMDTIYDYNSIGQMIQKTSRSIINGVASDYEKIEYSYDSNGNNITDIQSRYNQISWYYTYRSDIIYNSSGLKTSETTLGFDTSQLTWNNSLRFSYTFNGANLPDSDLIEVYSGSNWMNSHLTTYTYNSLGKSDIQLNFYWQNTTWNGPSRHKFYYNGSGYLEADSLSYLNGSNWTNTTENLFTFDNNGNLLTIYTDNYNPSYPIYLGVNTYDSNNNLITSVRWNDFNNPPFNDGDSTVYFYSLFIGINEAPDPVFDFSIYPNPAVDKVRLQFTNEIKLKTCDVHIYDIHLQEVACQKIDAESIELTTDQLSNGVYFIVLSNAAKIFAAQKLIINK
jgi:hypothetical protein